jgi:hypothetical protein
VNGSDSRRSSYSQRSHAMHRHLELPLCIILCINVMERCNLGKINRVLPQHRCSRTSSLSSLRLPFRHSASTSLELIPPVSLPVGNTNVNNKHRM